MIFSKKIKYFAITCLLLFLTQINYANTGEEKYVVNKASKKNFPIATNGKVAPILVSNDDFAGVKRVAGHLQTDIFNVTGSKPNMMMDKSSMEDYVIIIGTLGKSSIIDELVRTRKIKTKDLKALAEALGNTEAMAAKYAKLVSETSVKGIDQIEFFETETPKLIQVK